MVDIIQLFFSFVAGLFALSVPGLGVSFGTLATGLLVLSTLFWLLSRITGGDD